MSYDSKCGSRIAECREFSPTEEHHSQEECNVLCQKPHQEIIFSYIITNRKVQGRMLVDEKNFVDSNPLLAKPNTWKGGDTDLDTLCCGRPCDMWAQRLNYIIKTELVSGNKKVLESCQ